MKFSLIMLCSILIGLGVTQVSAQNLSYMTNESSPPTTRSDAIVNIETPLVSIETIDFRQRLFKYTPAPALPKTIIDRATEITQDAYFQRKRFDETGQAIEIDRDHLYYRRDAYSYTKGIIFYNFFNNRMDVGLFRSHFSPASTLLSSSIQPVFSQADSNGVIFRNGGRVFVSVRMKLGRQK